MSYRRRRGLGGRRVNGSETGSAVDSLRNRRLLIGAGVVLGSLAAGYLFSWLILSPTSATANDASVKRVPDVVGMLEADARARVADTGLELAVRGGLAHRSLPEGAVVAQSPLAGQFARPGAPVEVTLSRGPEVHTLPDVAGLSERQALIVLERLGFEVVVERREDPMTAGRAVETRPGAGAELQVPGEILLVVSEGAPIVVVPDLLGMHIDDALEILADGSLELGSISFDETAPQAPGRIVGQYPPVGYSLRAGDAVELRVAGTPERLERSSEGEQGLL